MLIKIILILTKETKYDSNTDQGNKNITIVLAKMTNINNNNDQNNQQ